MCTTTELVSREETFQIEVILYTSKKQGNQLFNSIKQYHSTSILSCVGM